MSLFVNTVELDFGLPKPALQIKQIHNWLRTVGVAENKVFSIMAVLFAETQTVRDKLNNEDYTELKNTHEGIRTIKDNERNIQVIIRPAGIKEKYVRLTDIPFEIELEEVKKV